ncbi:hypothetical protein E2C01_069402 [Portunus trituberculatus]|uniref:Uncharacterized protein n=1 Tax=Portunus trituberculatus TaxID=210409 RepID=A0A5B7HZ96_PORTR|nr:hypothetical protein [Portunus trituberculatus]
MTFFHLCTNNLFGSCPAIEQLWAASGCCCRRAAPLVPSQYCSVLEQRRPHNIALGNTGVSRTQGCDNLGQYLLWGLTAARRASAPSPGALQAWRLVRRECARAGRGGGGRAAGPPSDGHPAGRRVAAAPPCEARPEPPPLLLV